MKVLFITNNLLDGNGGGSFASRSFVNAFSEVADTCLLVYPDKGKNIRPYIDHRIILHSIEDKNKLTRFIDIYRGKINRYEHAVIPILATFKPDLIVFDGSLTSAGLIKIIRSQVNKIIVIHHNFEMEYYKGTPPSIFWRFPFMYHLKNAERDAFQNSDLNLTLTNQDSNLLRLNYDSEGISKTEKWGCFEPISTSDSLIKENDSTKKKITFAITGSLGSYQTEVSLIPFLKYIYPNLLKTLPESKLIIAGKNPSYKLIKECAKHPSINLIPNPEDMQLVICRADVYICPTNVGGGLKLRVMDGLKAGLPVLTHLVSARGYDDFKKAGCLFEYDNEQSFIQSMESILKEKEKGNLNKVEIQKLYWSLFSFESGVQKLRDLLLKYNLKSYLN